MCPDCLQGEPFIQFILISSSLCAKIVRDATRIVIMILPKTKKVDFIDVSLEVITVLYCCYSIR